MQVARLDGDTLGVDGAQVGVSVHAAKPQLSGLLQGLNGFLLKADVAVQLGTNLADKAMEGFLRSRTESYMEHLRGHEFSGSRHSQSNQMTMHVRKESWCSRNHRHELRGDELYHFRNKKSSALLVLAYLAQSDGAGVEAVGLLLTPRRGGGLPRSLGVELLSRRLQAEFAAATHIMTRPRGSWQGQLRMW